MTNFREIAPIDFDLYDKDSQNTIYIEDTSDQLLTFKVKNSSTQNIKLDDLSGSVGPDNYHYALRFRPGTLSDVTLNIDQPTTDHMIALAIDTDADWDMAIDLHTVDDLGMDVIYLRRKTTNVVFGPDTTQTIVFRNVGADASQGARGTRVELHCTAMKYQDSSIPLDAQRETHLNIINHRGKKNIPLHVGFVGDNGVINDGVSSNNLKLRFTNTAPYDLTNTDKAQLQFKADADDTKKSKIIISFDNGNQDTEWALGAQTGNNKIEIPAIAGWSGHGIVSQGQTPQWTLYPDQSMTLPGKDAPSTLNANYFEIEINNIITNYPTGHTHLHVRYENIPGYWDGEKVLVIEKRPLMYKHKSDVTNKNVGIGTNTPEYKLDVKGDVRLGDPAQRSVLEIADIEGAKYQIATGGYNLTFSKHWLKSNGDSGYKDAMALLGLYPGNENPDLRVYNNLLVDGNVGVGKDTPSEKLDVAGNLNTSGKLKEAGHDLIPKGTIVMFNGSTAPEGWAICNGENGTPDLKDRFIVGTGDDYKTGQTGGLKEVSISVDQMPQHNHEVNDPGHSHETDWLMRYSSTDDDDDSLPIYARNSASYWNVKKSKTNITIQNSGNGEPHENLPPYYALCFIMKT